MPPRSTRNVRGRAPRPDLGEPFGRFPAWMWRNTDVDAFVAWMRMHNCDRGADDQARFYGLDLYNMATRCVR